MRLSCFHNLGAGFALAVAFTAALARGTAIEWRCTAGCGIPHKVDGQSRDFSIQSSGRNRTYRIHLPLSYDANTPAPLSISYHGSKQTAADQETTSCLSNDSVNPNMIAVYPQGIDASALFFNNHFAYYVDDKCVQNHWEGAPYSTPGVSDKTFTTDLLAHLKSNYCIDPQRIYASGLSNGGGFVDVLACSHGADFAAFAPVAGAFYEDVTNKSTCSPARPLTPILEIHGLNDNRIPYLGGRGRKKAPLPSISDWAARWAVRDGCASSACAVQEDFKDPTGSFIAYSVFTYSCGEGAENVVTHYALNNTRHVWPTTEDAPIEATPIIIDFFSKHTLYGGESVVIHSSL